LIGAEEFAGLEEDDDGWLLVDDDGADEKVRNLRSDVNCHTREILKI
jgi:hypothetical protein